MMRETLVQFVFYVIFAGIATVVDIGVLFLLTKTLGLFYLISATFSYICGIITNFSLNRTFNFGKTDGIIIQFPKFLLVAGIGLLLNNLILFFWVGWIHLDLFTAKLLTVFIVMFWSFTGHKVFTFNNSVL